MISKDKQDEIINKLFNINENFKLIEENKIKIANLLMNTHISSSNCIKLKHEEKFKFIKLVKILISQLENDSMIDFIYYSSNIHPQIINNIVYIFKYNYNRMKNMMNIQHL